MQSDLEIDCALALAIGWKDEPNKMRVSNIIGLQVWIGYWANFSYRDWNVIGPIAARYDCFPSSFHCGIRNEWGAYSTVYRFADTPQKAIALAVIHGAKK